MVAILFLVLRLVHSWLPCCCLIVLSISMVALQYCYKFLDSHSRVAMLLLNLVKNLYSSHVGFEFWLVYSWLPCCYLDKVRTFMVAVFLVNLPWLPGCYQILFKTSMVAMLLLNLGHHFFYGCHVIIDLWLVHSWLPCCYLIFVSTSTVAMLLLDIGHSFHGCHVFIKFYSSLSWLPCYYWFCNKYFHGCHVNLLQTKLFNLESLCKPL